MPSLATQRERVHYRLIGSRGEGGKRSCLSRRKPPPPGAVSMRVLPVPRGPHVHACLAWHFTDRRFVLNVILAVTAQAVDASQETDRLLGAFLLLVGDLHRGAFVTLPSHVAGGVQAPSPRITNTPPPLSSRSCCRGEVRIEHVVEDDGQGPGARGPEASADGSRSFVPERRTTYCWETSFRRVTWKSLGKEAF